MSWGRASHHGAGLVSKTEVTTVTVNRGHINIYQNLITYYETEMEPEVGAIYISNPHPPEIGGEKNLMFITGKITIRSCLGLILP